jgi:hypothetical protein
MVLGATLTLLSLIVAFVFRWPQSPDKRKQCEAEEATPPAAAY